MSFTVDASVMDFLNSNNLTMAYNSVPLELGQVMTARGRWDVYAPRGFGFKVYSNGNDIAFGQRSPMGGGSYFLLGDNQSHGYKENTLLSNSRSFTVTLVEVLMDTAQGINNAYRITNNDAKIFMQKEYISYYPNATPDKINHKNNLIGLIDIPFTIDDGFIIDTLPITLGNHEIDITGDLLETDSYTVDMGTINTPLSSYDSLDYMGVTCILHLPYAESMNIDSDYCINESLTIEYVINLYDGMTVINVSSSKIDGVIASQNVDLKVSIPFGRGEVIPSRNDPHNVEMGVNNGVLTCYLEVLQNDAILKNGVFTIPVIDENLLSSFTGFIKVNDIELQTTAKNTEKQMIINSLTQGVYL